MGQLFLLKAIAALIMTLLVVPLSKKIRNKELSTKSVGIGAVIVFIVSFISVFLTVYISKIDLSWTIFLYVLPVIGIFGAVIAWAAVYPLKRERSSTSSASSFLHRWQPFLKRAYRLL